MPNDDASNVNNNADEDDDRRRRAAASTRPDTHDHTLDRTPRHSLDDVTDDHNGRPGRRRTARLPAVSNHRRLLLSPLWLLIALATMLGLNASSAAAGGGLETRVRAFDHVTVDAVGQPSSERPASVGCLRPSQPGFASGSCVATEAVPGGVDTGMVHGPPLGRPNFVANANGEVVPVPEGAVGPTMVDSGKGFQFTGGSGGRGLDPRVTDVRIMDPVTSGKYTYPDGYVSYSNGATPPQTVNPWTGQTVANADPWAHWPWGPK